MSVNDFMRVRQALLAARERTANDCWTVATRGGLYRVTITEATATGHHVTAATDFLSPDACCWYLDGLAAPLPLPTTLPGAAHGIAAE